MSHTMKARAASISVGNGRAAALRRVEMYRGTKNENLLLVSLGIFTFVLGF